ncbi:MAG: sulfatase-like hydrolase/transferase [Acidobacteriota bacterium]
MRRRDFMRTVGAGAAWALHGFAFSSVQTEVRKPNIVLIMADDLGAECLGCYGGTSYRTPHLDVLAASGIRFENAYCTPVCTPSRVQLMTGQYPFHNGWPDGIWTKPRDQKFLDPGLFNFAQMLKGAGYATAVAGKWQLARFEDRPHHAAEIGFDEHCLWTWEYETEDPNMAKEGGARLARYWDPGVWKNGALMENTRGKFGPDIYTDFLLDFMERKKTEPFFVYYPMALTHWPFVPTPDMEGDKDGARRGPEAQKNFAAMVEYMDKLVKRIVDKLDELGIRENTLVLFTGDNGTAQELESGLNGRVISGGKNTLTEEGARVPLIAHWKGITPEGRVSEDLIDFTDMLPTFADMAGARLPAGARIDGRSFLPQLRGQAGNPRDWIYCQLVDDWFIRDKRWRLRKNGELADLSDRYWPRVVTENSSPQAAAAKRRLSREMASLRAS